MAAFTYPLQFITYNFFYSPLYNPKNWKFCYDVME